MEGGGGPSVGRMSEVLALSKTETVKNEQTVPMIPAFDLRVRASALLLAGSCQVVLAPNGSCYVGKNDKQICERSVFHANERKRANIKAILTLSASECSPAWREGDD